MTDERALQTILLDFGETNRDASQRGFGSSVISIDTVEFVNIRKNLIAGKLGGLRGCLNPITG